MNREVKFRGKRIDNGEWIFGDLIQDSKGAVAIWPIASVNSNGMEEVAPSSIGQYTGCKDCKGNEIYEGDIVAHEREAFFSSIIVKSYFIMVAFASVSISPLILWEMFVISVSGK